MNEREQLIAYWEKTLEISDRIGPFVIDRIRQTIAALRQQQGESVGYVRKESIDDVKKWSGAKIFVSDEDDGRNTIPLFTSPPQQEGMVLVPVEPTPEMLEIGVDVENKTFTEADEHTLLRDVRKAQVRAAYKAMIAAKP